MNASVPSPTAIARALAEVLGGDAGAVVLVEGAGPVADELAAAFPDRVLALPVADRATLGVAVGLAWGGRRVIVELAAGSRVPALVEVLTEACAPRDGFPASIVVRLPWGGEAGPLDGEVLDLLASIPGLRVVCPRDGGRAGALLRAAVRAGGPVVVLEPRSLLRSSAGASPEVALDRVDVVRAGRHVTLAAFGPGVDVALAAADALAGEGIEAVVVDLVALAPLDAAGLSAEVSRTGRLVVLAPEAAHADRVLRAATAGAFWSLEAPPVAVPVDVTASVRAAREACHG